nr:pentatricopeptide repeat-containing protein At2g13600-like [Tanacetum cinerariifolium]
SGIQVKGLVHYFFADDTSHSQNEEIYMELKTLKKQMIQVPKEQDAFFAQFIA